MTLKDMAYLAMYTPRPSIEQRYALTLYVRRNYKYISSYHKIFARVVRSVCT